MVPRTTSRGLKRESTVSHGLITPDESMSSSIGTAHPKKEESDIESLSDRLQDKFQDSRSFDNHHGPLYETEGFGSEVAERQRRSASVSVRSSFPPQLHNSNIRNNLPWSLPTMPSPPNELSERKTVFEVLGRDSKRLLDTLEDLRRIGLKSIEKHIPELVMVGDQSAGKSSLMSAIAGVNLPTGQSMCTQCPTNIKTSDAGKWTCKVFLQQQYTYVPLQPNQEFPNWAERKEGMLTTHFKTIDDESEMEEVLKWAQIALLNPSESFKCFVPGSDAWDHQHQLRQQDRDYEEEVRFSPNVIAVEISGPGLPAFSFFDLPGLFQTAAHKGQEYLVKVFDALTVKYVKHEKALIICAITMGQDPGLSHTKRVIAECEANDRCIGVLTMPDKLNSTDYDSILREKTYVLPHGYFVTKQPGKDCSFRRDPHYYALARQDEDRFFTTDEKWRDGGEWAEFRPRCGTATLQKYLAREFVKLILNSLPDLERKIKNQTTQVDLELSRLPEIKTDKTQHIVRQRLFEFANQVRSLLDGSPDSMSNTFHGEWKRLCYQFQRATEQMRPGCKVAHPSDDQRLVITIDDDSDDEGNAVQSRPQARSKRPLDSPQLNGAGNKRIRYTISPSPAPTKSEEGPFAYVSLSASTPSPRVHASKKRPGLGGQSLAFKRLKPEDFGPFYKGYLDSGHAAMSIADIQDSIKANGRVGIPEFINPKVKEDFALTSIIPWEQPLQDFLESTFKMLRDHIHGVLSDVLANYKDTCLYKSSRPIIDRFIRKHEEKQREKLLDVYNIEKSTLFTINDQTFELHKSDALRHLRAQRRRIRVNTYLEKAYCTSNHKMTLEDYKIDQKDKVPDDKLGPDPFEKELEVAAYIRGYYNTARLRFTDSVCAKLNFSLFHDIKMGTKYLLETELGLDQDGGGEAKCQELLAGNADMVKRRNALIEQRAKLLESKEVLNRLRDDPGQDEAASLHTESVAHGNSNGGGVDLDDPF